MEVNLRIFNAVGQQVAEITGKPEPVNDFLATHIYNNSHLGMQSRQFYYHIEQIPEGR
jgi:hypothetical protein